MKKTDIVNLLIVFVAGLLAGCNRNIVPDEVSGRKIKTFDTATFNYIFVEAVKQKLMGNGGEALKYLEEGIRINPESDAAYFQMAQILVAAGDLNNGKKYALKAFSIDQRNFWYLMMLAGTYYQEKSLDSAILFYEKAVKTFPEKADLQVALANLYSEDRKFDRAAQIYENLEKKYGINESSSAGVVKNLMWAGKWDEALERAKLLLREYPDVIIYNGLLAEIYRGKGEPGKAMEVYRMLIERNPENPEIQLAIFDFLIEEKKYEELFPLITSAIINSRIKREDKVTLFARIIENPEIAKAGENQVLISVMLLESEYPDDDLILMLRPEMLIAQGKTDKAEERLNELISNRPDYYYAWEKILLLYLENRDYQNLEIRGRECSSKFNRSFLAKVLYATALTENKKYEVAIEELRKAEILAGNNQEMIMQVLTMRADIFYRQKDYDNAFSTFDEALKKNSNDLTLLNNYAYYLAEQNMNLKEAEEMSRKVIETENNNNTFLDTYAWVLFKRGKYREAEKIMEKIISGNSQSDAEYYEHYGFILKKRHECEKAIRNWENAVKLDPKKQYLLKEIENCEK